jgi:hypothetical protein
MVGEMTISAGRPRVGSAGKIIEEVQDPFQAGIHDVAWHAMLFQGAGKPGNPCWRFRRLGDRRMDKDHRVIAIHA